MAKCSECVKKDHRISALEKQLQLKYLTGRTAAIAQCARWLRACIQAGWREADIPALRQLWWDHHDENGLLKSKKERNG